MCSGVTLRASPILINEKIILGNEFSPGAAPFAAEWHANNQGGSTINQVRPSAGIFTGTRALHASYSYLLAKKHLPKDVDGDPAAKSIKHAHFNEAWVMQGEKK